MSAPRHLIDALECVVSLFFSNVRLKERAAYILCDELVEVTCREKIKSKRTGKKPLGEMTFYGHLTHQDVGFDVNAPGLGKHIHDCHKIRNDMQHNNAAASVDEHHCADAILDAVRVLDHCFPGTSAALPDKIKVALRVVELFGQNADVGARERFSEEMRRETWRTQDRKIYVGEVAFAAGDRQNWHLVIFAATANVEQILNRVCPPPNP